MSVKRFVSQKLTRQLALLLIASCALAFGLFWGLSALSDEMICRYYAKRPEIVLDSARSQMDQFQRIVSAHSLAAGDSNAISEWVGRQPPLLMQIYRDGQLLYDASLSTASELHTHLEIPSLAPQRVVRTLAFSDGPAEVMLTTFPEHAAMDTARFLLAVGCFFCFLLLTVAVIRRKIARIVLLEQEVQAIAGGETTLPLTRRGEDELSTLTACIDGMRWALVERLDRGAERNQERYQFVAALSHDLRTPLTALKGYLEVLARRLLPEQERGYVEKCIGKAERLKALTDMLLCSFAPSNAMAESMSALDAAALNGMLAPHVCSLEEAGFSVEMDDLPATAHALAHPDAVLRVLENVFSNVEKYADRAKPVCIRFRETDVLFRMEVFNSVPEDADPRAMDFGLGLHICENLMRNMQGSFEVQMSEHGFLCRIAFWQYPLCD